MPKSVWSAAWRKQFCSLMGGLSRVRCRRSRTSSQATLLGNERLVLDLSRVSFVGRAALRVILVTAKRLGVSGGRLAVCAAPQIAQVFVVAGLDAVLPVHVSLDEARGALA